MRKSNVLITLVLTIIAASGSVMVAYAATTMRIDPVTSTAQPDESFSVNIDIADVTDLFAWGVRLEWDPVLLNATEVVEGPFLQDQPEGTLFVRNINNTGGYVDLGCTTAGDYAGVSGSGTLATVTFLVKGTGVSALNLTGADILDSFLDSLPLQTQNGYFTNSPETHDVAITNVTASPTLVAPGENVTISVTAKNEGDFTETFNVTVYYDDNTISTQTVTSLAEDDTTTLTFSWNTTGLTTGGYIIKAAASIVAAEADTTDNTFTDGTVTISGHDVAVVQVNAGKARATIGETVPIVVSVKNKGTITENITVTCYYDDTVISTQTITNLAPGGTTGVTFQWDTTGVPEGDYLAKGVADAVPGETNIADNTLTSPWYNAVSLSAAEQGFSTELIIYIVVAAVVLAIAGCAFFIYKRRKT